MKKRSVLLISALACACCLIVFCACTAQNGTGTSGSQPATQAPTEPPTEDPVKKQVQSMSTAEKVGQLVTAGFDGYEADETLQDLITNKHIGGAILFSDNIENAQQLTDLTNQIKETAQNGIPLLLGMDEEGGDVSRLPDDVQSMPSAYRIAQSQDTDYCYNAGKNIAAQVTAFGLHTGFSPDLDIWSNKDNTVIGMRAFGTNAQSVVSYGTAVMNGMRDGGAIPVVKHFPGHGDTDTDSHYSLPVVTKTKDQLQQEELVPFQAAIEQNVPAIMVAHILCSQLDDSYPASLSKEVVQKLLRDEMGFDGVVYTDDMTMGAIVENYSLEQACVLAVNAGCDMLLVCHEYDNVYTVLERLGAAVADGTIPMQRLDEAVTRILKLKAGYAVTADRITLPDIDSMNAATQAFWN